MSVDDIVKLLLAGSFTFAIVGISYALIKFILSCTSAVEDARKPIQNIGELSDLALEDYRSIRGIVRIASRIVEEVSGYFENPLNLGKKIVSVFNRKGDSEL